jgi:GTPase SAR1 family protein
MASSYFKRGVDGILLCFDVTSEQSFTNLYSWMDQIRQHAPENVKVVLVGTKIDLDTRVITAEQGASKCKELELCQYIETSAKDNNSVSDAFEGLVDHILGITPSSNGSPISPVFSNKSSTPTADDGVIILSWKTKAPTRGKKIMKQEETTKTETITSNSSLDSNIASAHSDTTNQAQEQVEEPKSSCSC